MPGYFRAFCFVDQTPCLIEYIGSLAYNDNDLSFLQTEEGRVIPFESGNEKDWRYEYNIKDHLGNTRVVFSESTDTASMAVMQTSSYYPFGMIMEQTNYTVSTTNYRKNNYLYNGKEIQDDDLDGESLSWYDYGARMYDPTIGRWHGVDRFAEKYANMTPYHYGANNPIRFIDINGDSLNVVASASAIEKYNNVNTESMGGYYTTEVDECGNVSICSTGKDGKMTNEQESYYKSLSSIVDDENTTSVEIVESDKGTLIGDVTTGKIDIDDVLKIGHGNINSGGALMHEMSEQFAKQVKGYNNTRSHQYASGVESSIYGFGCVRSLYSPIHYTRGSYYTDNIGFIEVNVGNSTVYLDVVNNNVINTVGNDR